VPADLSQCGPTFPLLRVGDHRHAHRRCIYELSATGFSADLVGIGSSPFQGDAGTTGLIVPEAPTPDQTHRYLFRLAAIEVPPGAALWMRGLRLAVTIGADVPVPNQNCLYGLELDVTSSFWAFQDGNVSFHFRTQPLRASGLLTPTSLLPATDVGFENSLDSALLYLPGNLVPYVPPGAGQPPGYGIGSLGTIRDPNRFPWQNEQGHTVDIHISGPRTIALYASVHQTDPATRCVLPTVADTSALSPEDRFVLQYPQARYKRVAGAIIGELYPCSIPHVSRWGEDCDP
jgi:hypothetical protein